MCVASLLPAAAHGQKVEFAAFETSSLASGTTVTPATRRTVGGNDLVQTARHFLGVRYRMGGTTPHAFDCSGFVRYVFAKNGIDLPRTAHEQAALGDAPAVGDSLLPGDLLFFYGGHGAQHVAIYVGADTIIHASSSGHRVKYDLLDRSQWFRKRLIAVRRLLPES